MKTLLAEDDFATRKFMDKYLSQYGECDVTVDGEEAVDAFMMALEDEYGITLPEGEGQAAKVKRYLEKNNVTYKEEI